MARLPRKHTLLLAAAVLAVFAVPLPASGAGTVEPGRQVLPADDGWAAAGTGTTGGSAADAAHVFTVTTKAQLVAALATGTVPKIIYVRNTVKGNVDAAN